MLRLYWQLLIAHTTHMLFARIKQRASDTFLLFPEDGMRGIQVNNPVPYL